MPRPLLAALPVALCCNAAIATPPTDELVVPLTIEEALARAEAHSPLVERSRAARSTVASRRVGAALLLPANPWLGVLGGLATLPGQPDSSWLTVHLEQQVEVAGQRGARLREVDRAVAVAAARERFAVAEARAQARQAYVGALLAGRYVAAASRREETMARLKEAVAARVETGAASEVELNLAELEYSRVAVERVDAELRLAEHTATLRLLVGLGPGAELRLTSTLPERLAELPPLPELLAAARRARSDLQALAATGDQLAATIERLRREAAPNPSLFVELQRVPFPDQLYLGAGLSLPLPVARRNQGELAEARALRAQSQAEQLAAEREVEREVAAAYAMARQRAVQAELYERRFLPAAERVLALVSDGWQAGKFDLYRVMVAAHEAADAERNRIAAQASMWQAAIDLDRATGSP